MRSGDQFFNLYNHDFVPVAAATPRVKIADPAFNAHETIALMQKATDGRSVLALFPEVAISAYSATIFSTRKRCSAGASLLSSRFSKRPGSFHLYLSSACLSRSIIFSITAQ